MTPIISGISPGADTTLAPGDVLTFTGDALLPTAGRETRVLLGDTPCEVVSTTDTEVRLFCCTELPVPCLSLR